MTYPVLPANGPSGYNLTNSLRFRRSASAYLTRTPASAGNRQIMTYSFWIKRGFVGSPTSDDYCPISAYTDASNLAVFYFNSSNSQSFDVFFKVSGTNYAITTTQVFRDPSAWYHIVVAIDTTQATASNRTKIYINGSQVTSFLSASYVPQNSNLATNNNVAQYFGTQYTSSSYYDGYMTEINFIDGQALTPSSFGSTNSTTGVWQPAKYTGTYGTNGFYLNFSNIALTSGSNTGLGKDYSGNGNYWNTNNISVTAGTTYDAMLDVPTNTSATVANYAVLNPLDNTAVLSEANLKITYTGAATWHGARGSIYVSSGKYYWEVNVVQVGYLMIGVASPSFSLDNTYGSNTYNWTYFQPNGNKYGPGIGGSGSAYGASYTAGDVIGVALDMDAGTLTFYKNNTSQGTAFTGITGLVAPVIALDNETGSGGIAAANFGQRPFSYTPPTGYVALNTYNLPTSTIVQGNKYMDATLYTGNGSAGTDVQTITNASGFKPDLVWTKCRSSAYSHHIGDSVRGIDKTLFSNTTGAEATYTYDIHAFNSNGFTVGNDGSQNTSGQTYVGWQWQAGQGSTSSNTNGSITSTVSVNASAGFSIVTYTGTGSVSTVGHGLGVAPRMVIVKSRSAGSTDWVVYHASLGATQNVRLQSTAAAATQTVMWNDTAPTSTVFTIGTNNNVNTNAQTQVAYCWAEIAGFSKFGSYTGNGSTDGPFVYLGFRPKFVMIKSSSNAYDWLMYDTSRNTYNLTTQVLYADLSNAESTGTIYDVLDILSNGFKIKGTNNAINGSGYTQIFMAFAENPFKNSLAR